MCVILVILDGQVNSIFRLHVIYKKRKNILKISSFKMNPRPLALVPRPRLPRVNMGKTNHVNSLYACDDRIGTLGIHKKKSSKIDELTCRGSKTPSITRK